MGDYLSQTYSTPKKSWDELGLVLYLQNVIVREHSLWSKRLRAHHNLKAHLKNYDMDWFLMWISCKQIETFAFRSI